MPVLADSSVLILLAKLGRFGLLRQLYRELLITPGIYSEVVEQGRGLAGSRETSQGLEQGWIWIRDPQDRSRVAELAAEYGLSPADAELIQLGFELRPELVLVDEPKSRKLLVQAGVQVRGCLGILIQAAELGLISKQQASRDLRSLLELGYLSPKLLEAALQRLR